MARNHSLRSSHHDQHPRAATLLFLLILAGCGGGKSIVAVPIQPSPHKDPFTGTPVTIKVVDARRFVGSDGDYSSTFVHPDIQDASWIVGRMADGTYVRTEAESPLNAVLREATNGLHAAGFHVQESDSVVEVRFKRLWTHTTAGPAAFSKVATLTCALDLEVQVGDLVLPVTISIPTKGRKAHNKPRAYAKATTRCLQDIPDRIEAIARANKAKLAPESELR